MSLRALEYAVYRLHPYAQDPERPGHCDECGSGPDLLEHRAGGDQLAVRILTILADNADHDGRGAAVSKARLSRLTGAGESTVYLRIRKLERLGLITAGDPAVVAYLPANARPRVWDLPRLGVQKLHPRKPPRGAKAAPRKRPRRGVQRGYNGGATGVQTAAPKPVDPLDPVDPRGAGDPPAAGAAGGGHLSGPAAAALLRAAIRPGRAD